MNDRSNEPGRPDSAPLPLEAIGEAKRVELLLHPLRRAILREAVEPRSASEIARRLGDTPQRVNYHLRTLADAGLLRPAGEERKGNLVEKRFRASAHTYLVLPAVLGEMAADPARIGEAFSAAHLLSVLARSQNELGGLLVEGEGGVETPTLTVDAEIRFRDAAQRAAFARALAAAVEEVVRRHTEPAERSGEDSTDGPRGGSSEGSGSGSDAWRLVVACHPTR